MDEASPFDRAMCHYEQRYTETGNGLYLLLAVDLCVATGRVTPLWAANAFSCDLTPWFLHQNETLDDALKAKRPKLERNSNTDEQAGARQRREDLRGKIIVRVWQRHTQNGEPIDERMFRRIAREIGAGLSVVKETYYDAESETLRMVFGLPVKGSRKGKL